MPRLTQRRAGRSDNNEAGKSPWFDATMTPRIGSMFEHPPGVTPGEHIVLHHLSIQFRSTIESTKKQPYTTSLVLGVPSGFVSR
jgi:hypothetical protein